MQIFVNTANNIPLNSTHREDLETRVSDALAAIEHNVVSVSIFVHDESTAKSGHEVGCRMVAEVPDGPAIVTEDTAPSVQLAAQAAAEELVVRIRRYWDRRNTKDRHAQGGLVTAPPPDSIDAGEIVASLS